MCLDKRAKVFLVLSDEHILDVLVPAFRIHLLGLLQRRVGRGGRGGEGGGEGGGVLLRRP